MSQTSFGERGATHDFTGVTHENFENHVLLGVRLMATPPRMTRWLSGSSVEIGDPEDDGARGVRASQEGMDASQELRESERFGEVVVSHPC